MKKTVLSIPIEIKEGLFLTIYPISEHAKIFKIEEEEALKFGEATIQILESKRYEYEFSKPEYQLQATKECIPSKNKTASRGVIAPGNYVGTLELNIKGPTDDFKYHLEVLATKFDAADNYDKGYRRDYRSMVEDITEKCTELLMQSNSPVNQYFQQDFSKDNKTIYQKFSFVSSVINKDEFEESLLKIFSSPKTSWVNKEESVDIRSLKRVTNKNLKEILRGTNRIPLNSSHNLYKKDRLESVPAKINNYKQEQSLDNPENRFVKHTLKEYLQFFENCSTVFKKDSKDKKEADFLVQKLENFLNHSFFKEISRPITLKLNSPTLQRKGGYRQLLKSWLMFDLASKLTWNNEEEYEVYEAGKRDIATLYEYWLFFVLYDLFKTKFDLTELTHNEKSYNHLFEPTKNGLNLIIKSGYHTALKGSKVIKNRDLSFKFSFNRTFSGNKNGYPKAGSWTTSMRPDYTLSVWPTKMGEKNAEIEEQIVHIHFDAKYKVNHFKIDSNETKGDLSEVEEKQQRQKLNKIKKEERAGKYKNADILKMHAYKDAIRRTGGAYILYPGTEKTEFRGFHELIPGLGAFSVNPKNESKDILDLSDFIDKVIDELVNRTSQRENIATKTYEISKEKTNLSLNEPLPEYLQGAKLIPDEVHVLVGFYNDEIQYDWISKKKMYNFRMGSGNGSLVLNKETVSAKYLLLHTHKDKSSGDLWKIISKGPKVFSRLNLEKKGYSKAEKESDYLKHYLIIELEKVNLKEFGNNKWDFRKLINYNSGNASAKPFTTTLTELMNNKVKEA